MPYFTKYFCTYRLDENNTLILNTLTKARDIVDNMAMDTINKVINSEKDINNIDEELFTSLKKRGYILNSKDDEKNMLKKYQAMRGKIINSLVDINSWTICPSTECNLRCPYCYEEQFQHISSNRMTSKQLSVIFDYILNQKSKKSNKPETSISIFGGEPLLKENYEMVEKILKFAKKHNFFAGIPTNGTTLNAAYLNLVSRYRDNLIGLQITLDGDKIEHDKKRIYSNRDGTFDIICSNIDMILKNNIQLSIRINIDKKNVQRLGLLKELFYKQGWSQNPYFFVYAAPVRIYSKNKIAIDDSEMLDILVENNWYNDSFISKIDSSVLDCVQNFLDDPEKGESLRLWNISYCSATYCSHYCFTPNGIITTCLRGAGKESYMVGTFDENSVKIDKSKLSMWKNRDPFTMEKCRDCKFILLCGGGCAKSSIMKHGDINCGVCNDIEKTLEVYVKHNKNKFLRKEI